MLYIIKYTAVKQSTVKHKCRIGQRCWPSFVLFDAIICISIECTTIECTVSKCTTKKYINVKYTTVKKTAVIRNCRIDYQSEPIFSLFNDVQ